MKERSACFLFACALLVATVISSRSYVNSPTPTNASVNSRAVFLVDGGNPMPPFPPPPSGLRSNAIAPVLSADGGNPMPPFPPPPSSKSFRL